MWDEASLARVHQVPDKARRVRAMFDAIVGRYERVNTLTAFGMDGVWRRSLVRAVDLPGAARVLDVACGTGQVVRAFRRHRREAAELWGVDFSGEMVAEARRLEVMRSGQRGVVARYVQGDAMRLPFEDNRFDAVTCAFGVRNFAEMGAGLSEMLRVLRGGGMAGILEFSMPRARVVGSIYKAYFRRVLPRVAEWLSGDRGGAYRYLQRSVEAFSRDVDLGEQLRRCGFERVEVRRLTLGVVAMYTARKPTGERA